MKKLVLCGLSLIGVFSLAIGAAILAGKLAPLSPGLAYWHLTDCALPCWNGVTPGVTSIDDAQVRIANTLTDFSIDPKNDNDYHVNWFMTNSQDPIIIALELNTGSITSITARADYETSKMPMLEEMISFWGSPTCLLLAPDMYSGLLIYENFFHEPYKTVIIGFNKLRLSSPIAYFTIGDSLPSRCADFQAANWQGFREPMQYVDQNHPHFFSR